MELELLILPGKMSSPKVSMVFMLLDLFPVSGGGANPPFHIGSLVDRYFSGQWNFEGANCSKILLVRSALLKVYKTA
jgi:hypothetical protein